MSEQIIEVVSVKSEVVHALNAVLKSEAEMYEADWANMEMPEARSRAEEILAFSKFVNNINNVDF